MFYYGVVWLRVMLKTRQAFRPRNIKYFVMMCIMNMTRLSEKSDKTFLKGKVWWGKYVAQGNTWAKGAPAIPNTKGDSPLA